MWEHDAGVLDAAKACVRAADNSTPLGAPAVYQMLLTLCCDVRRLLWLELCENRTL